MAPLCSSCGKDIEFDANGAAQNAAMKNAKRVREKSAPPVYCCNDCNRLSARLYKLQAQGGSLKTDFQGMSGGDKKQFFAEHADFLGKDLAAAIKSLAKKSSSIEETERFASTGEWIDEEDLEKRYASKPLQLASIKERARAMTHPARGCLMYEDIVFSTAASSENKRKQEQSAEIETESKAKKPKTVKAEQESKEKPDRGLTDKAREKYAKLQMKLQTQVDAMRESVGAASEEKIKDCVAPIVIKNVQGALLESEAVGASLAMMLEEGWQGKPSEVEKECREALGKMRVVAGHLDAQLQQAQEFVA